MEPLPVKNKRSSFGFNVMKLASGKVLAQVIAILVMPVVTRLYSPADFGVFQVFASITAVIIVISSLRYELAIMLPEKDEEAVNLLALSSIVVGFTAVTSLVCVVLFKDSIAEMLGFSELRFYLWFAPLVILTGGLLNVFKYWSSRRQQFGRVAFSGITTSISNAAVKLTVGLTGSAGPGGLIGGNIVGSLAGTVVLAGRSIYHDWSLFIKNVSITSIKQWAKRYKKFPLYSSWSALLNNATVQLPAIMLAFYFSPAIVGFYGLGNRVVKTPLNLLSEAIAKVFFQKASADKNNIGTTASVVEAVYQRLVYIAFFPMLALTVIGPDLFVVVFGAEWHEAGYFMQFFAPWLFFVFISSPLGTIYSVLEKQRMALILNIVKFSVAFIALFIGGILGDPRMAIIIFSISSMIVRALFSFITLNVSEVSAFKGVRPILNAAFYSIPFLVLIVVSKIFDISILFIVLLTIICGLIYMGFVVKNDGYFKMLLFNLLKRSAG